MGHSIENVISYLPKHLKEQVKAALRAAFRLSASVGMVRLEKQERWLESSIRVPPPICAKGCREMFTINRLGLSPSLSR